MNAREKLIKQLKARYFDFIDIESIESIADFILVDRKRIVNSVINLIPYLLFDTSPKGHEIWIQTLKQSAGVEE